MSYEHALSLFSGKYIPEDIAKQNADKLLAAISMLGDKHILKQQVQRLEVPRSY